MHDLAKYYARAAASPIEFGIFVALSAPLAILTFYFLYRRRNAAAFWTMIGFILVELAFRNGDDLQHHVPRVIGMADELRRGNFTGLLINDQTGQAFPIFVYYSFVPYIIPLLLYFLGFSAFVAIKLALGLYFLVFSFGLHLLIRKTFPNGAGSVDRNFGYLILLFFISANYVYGIFDLRDALGEIAVYTFIPWVCISLLDEKPAGLLTAFFLLQLTIHPVVFGQSLVCEIALALGISEIRVLALARKLILPIAFALILAGPFWLPQFVWLRLIAGNAVIPEPFSSTFLSLFQLLSPFYRYTAGPWLILSVIAMCAVFRKKLGGRAWLLSGLFILILAVQTTYLRPFSLRVPGMSIFQFAWRLMMPAAFAGFAALIAGLKGERIPATRPLTILAALAALNLFVTSFIFTPKYMKIPAYDEGSYRTYLRAENLFGVAIFGPNYARLRQDCAHAQGTASQAIGYDGLRHGVVPGQPFIAVANAPIGMVKYKSGDSFLVPSACGPDLVLGPLPAGKTVIVDDTKLRDLFYFRVFSLLIGVTLLLVSAVFPGRRGYPFKAELAET